MNRSSAWRLTALALIALALGWACPPSTIAQEHPTQIIFMHHSTGAGLIWQGGVRETFTGLGYEFWDHGYNDDGLVDPSGSNLGINWDMPGDNTDPDGWYAIFDQPVTDPPENTFSHMLQANVIIFKSCFPSSNITDEDMFRAYQRYFLSIRDVIDQHPDKLFIPFTTPPLVPNETTPDSAARARRWSEYLTSDEYLAGHPNIAVFDFFTLLADENGLLRAEYRSDEWDSHPNELANQTVGPIFVVFVDQAIREFAPSAAPAVSPGPITVEGDPHEEPDTGTESEAFSPASDLFGGFESADALEWWWEYTNDPARVFVCEPDEQAHSGNNALRLTFDIPPEGSAGCGVTFEADPGWADADGISFYWRADSPDLVMRVGLAVADPAHPDGSEPTLFDVELRAAGGEWSPVFVAWADVAKPEWLGDTGVDTFDPAQVVFIVFDVGVWDTWQVGSIWIDDLQLAVRQ
jgi:hypothetical protein